jgi:hypothetical protein
VSTGCFSQRTVQAIGEGDIVFLGPNGVQSLSRLQSERSFPMQNMTKYIRDTLLREVNLENAYTISSSYNNQLGQYFLSLPASGAVWCIDLRRKYKDEVDDLCAVCTRWTMVATAMWDSNQNNAFYIARNAGYVGTYSGYLDEGVPYTFSYLSPWLNLGTDMAQHLKMLKRFEVILYTGGSTSASLTWNTDFGNNTKTGFLTIPAAGISSQYGVGQYGIAQYGGGNIIYLAKYPARSRGQYYQVGVTTQVVNNFSLQQIQLATKIGRIA